MKSQVNISHKGVFDIDDNSSEFLNFKENVMSFNSFCLFAYSKSKLVIYDNLSFCKQIPSELLIGK